MAEVWAKIGEHGWSHGCAGDALLCDEHGGVKVLDLCGRDGAETGAWQECSEEGLDADIEGEVEGLEASVGRGDVDAGVPERLDEGGEVVACDADALGFACAAGGEQDVG